MPKTLIEVAEQEISTADEEHVNRLEDDFQQRDGDENYVRVSIGSSLEDAERMMIERTLAYVRNNKSKAARILGLSRKTIHNKVRKYRLA